MNICCIKFGAGSDDRNRSLDLEGLGVRHVPYPLRGGLLRLQLLPFAVGEFPTKHLPLH
jgi:hypothetical protein